MRECLYALFPEIYVYKSPLVSGGGSGDSWGKLESQRGEMFKIVKFLSLSSSLLAHWSISRQSQQLEEPESRRQPPHFSTWWISVSQGPWNLSSSGFY